jgi:hypothetical protein
LVFERLALADPEHAARRCLFHRHRDARNLAAAAPAVRHKILELVQEIHGRSFALGGGENFVKARIKAFLETA